MARRNTSGPSLFTAVQTKNNELIGNLRKVVCKGIEDNYYAKDYIVPLEEAHVTITVFDTSDKEFAREEFSKERNYVQYTFIKMLFLKHYKVKYSVRNGDDNL